MTNASRPDKFFRLLPYLVPLVYAGVLSLSITNEWFPADDAQELAFVQSLDSFWGLFGADTFGLFRPVKNFLFWLFVHLTPAVGIRGCRMVGIAIGVLSFFPVLALCRKVFANERKALASAAIWLLSPTLVSSVVWLSCVNIQIMVALSALAIVFHDDAFSANRCRPSRILFSGIFLFFALVSYECAIAVLPVLFLFDVLLRPERIRRRSAWLAYLFYFLTVEVYLVLRGCFHSTTQVNGSFESVLRWQLVVSSPFFTAQHFASWFWPFGRMTVCGSYQWGQVPWTGLILLAMIFASILLFAVLERKRFPILSFCILLALLAFAPVSNCLGLKNGPYGDYFLSLASIGLSAGTVEFCSILLRVKGSARRLAIAMVVAFAALRLASIPETARWAWLWGRGLEAHVESVNNFPDFFSHKLMLAQLFLDSGEYDKALTLCSEVERQVNPGTRWMARIYLIRALNVLIAEEDADRALDFLAKSEIMEENDREDVRNRHYYRGCVFDDLKGDEATAEKEYELALLGKWDIDSVPCADRLARIKAIHGDLAGAISIWEKAAKLDPNNEYIQWNLALARKKASGAGQDQNR